MADEQNFPCVCCGFVVFEEPIGHYQFCPVCGWQDDDVQARYPTLRGGANKDSLLGWQTDFREHVSDDERDCLGYLREEHWRPLSRADLSHAQEKPPETGMEYFLASGAEPATYYWKR